MVQEIVLPDRHMVVVVRRHRASNGKVKGEDVQIPMEAIIPLNEKHRSGNNQENQRPDISFEF